MHPHTRCTRLLAGGAVLLALLMMAGAPRAEDPPPARPAGTLLAQAKSTKAKVNIPFARITRAVKEHKTTQTELAGGGNLEFKDLPKRGSVLIGFEVSFGRFVNNITVRAVRPIYRNASGVAPGQYRGVPSGLVKRVQAKPGYAVGALTVKTGLGIDGMEITFMRIEGDTLDPSDSYKSDWLGGKGGGRERTLGGDGSLVVGFFGRTEGLQVARIELKGIGLILLPKGD